MGLDKDMTLGEFLRSERERRGVTLEQVASATKVGIRTLHALESDHYSELPAKPYIRGFVTSYCSFIGVDPSEVRTKYDDYITLRSKERPNREGGHSGYAFEKKDGQRQSRILLSIAMVSFLVVGGVAVLLLKPTLKHRKSSHLEKLKQAQEQNQAQSQIQQTVQPAGLVSSNLLPAVTLSPLPSQSVLPSPTPLLGLPAQAKPENQGVKASPLPNHSSSLESKTEVKNTISIPGQFVSSALRVVAPTHQAAGPLPAPVQSPSPSVGSNVQDPLDSGHDLSIAEAKHRLVFHTIRDVWVRYRVDEKPTRKFVIRAGRNLVLKARDRVVFQVSDPSALTVIHNRSGTPHLVSEASPMKVVQGNATLFYSESPALSAEDILQDSKPLPKAVEPKRDE
jgi:cytoskeletal protein RodZ